MENFKNSHRIKIYPPKPEQVPITKTIQEAEDMMLEETLSSIETIEETLYDPDTGLEGRVESMEAATVIVGDGAPTAPVASSVSLPIGTGISLDFTAKTKGAAGDNISIELVDPHAIKELSVSTAGEKITVYLGSDGTQVTSSLNDIKDAIEASTDAAKIVQVSITGDSGIKAIGVSETFLDGGKDGTVGAAGALRFDSSKLYISVDESTTAVSNWKYITLT